MSRVRRCHTRRWVLLAIGSKACIVYGSALCSAVGRCSLSWPDAHARGDKTMSLGLILIIILVIFLLGGFSGRFGGYGYGYGHGGVGVIGVILIVLVVLVLLGRL